MHWKYLQIFQMLTWKCPTIWIWFEKCSTKF